MKSTISLKPNIVFIPVSTSELPTEGFSRVTQAREAKATVFESVQW